MRTTEPGNPPTDPQASSSVEISAPADAVHAIVTDLDLMGELAQESTGVTWVRGDARTPGSVFRGHNRNGRRRWSTTCTVTDAVAPTLFAFEVTSVARIAVARWAYEIEALGVDRCRVTESTWDRRPGWFKKPGGWLTGVPDRVSASQEHIAATLARLQARAAS